MLLWGLPIQLLHSNGKIVLISVINECLIRFHDEITRAFLISAFGDRQKFFFFTLVARRVYQLGECRPEDGGGVEGGDGVEHIFVVESREENRRNMFATH